MADPDLQGLLEQMTDDELKQFISAQQPARTKTDMSQDVRPRNQYREILGSAARESVSALPPVAQFTQPRRYTEAFTGGVGPEMNRQMGVPEGQPGILSELLKSPVNPMMRSKDISQEIAKDPTNFAKASASEVAGAATSPLNYMIEPLVKILPVGKSTVGKLIQLPANRIRDAIKGTVAPEVVDRFIRKIETLKKLRKHLPSKLMQQEIKPKNEVIPNRDQFHLNAKDPGWLEGKADQLGQRARLLRMKAEQFPERKKFGREMISRAEEMEARAVEFRKQARAEVPNTTKPSVKIQGQQAVEPSLQEKFLSEVKAAKPVRREQESLYRKERTERFGKAEGASKTNRGQAGFEAEKSFLKGELPKSEFDPISSRFNQEELDSLLDMVKNSAKLEYIETVTGRNALLKMMHGKVPTEGELALLKKVFGNKLESILDGKLPLQDRLWKFLIQTGNLARAMMASADMSMPFRQGIFLISKPKQFIPAFKEMFRYFMSEKALNQFQSELALRPTFPLMKAAKLALTEMDGVLLKQEEQFMQANLAEKIPILGKIVRASNRAAIGFLNKLRADTFDDLIGKARKQGINVDDNIPLITSVADFINSATGRGNIKGMERALPVMNSLFFSPRLMMSRFNLLNPVYYMRLEPFARKEALKTLARTVTTLSSILYLAKLGGASVETDPTATDFGKIKIGNTRYDMGGGFLQWMRLYSQIVSGHQKTSGGKVIKFGEGYKPETRLSALMRFTEYKTAPILSLGISLLRQKDSIGNEVSIKTLPKEIAKRYVPLVFQDLYELYKERGIEALPMGIPAFFGVGTMTYKPNESKKKKSFTFK